MARAFTGSQRLTESAVYLAGAAAFTWCLWWRKVPNTASVLVESQGNSATNFWQIAHTNAGSIDVFTSIVGFGGTNPNTGANTGVLPASAATRGVHIGWRYDGTRWEVWYATHDGRITKKTISGSIAFTLPSLTGTPATALGARPGGTAQSLGDLAEVSLWSRGLSDDELTAILRGVTADSLPRAGLVRYWPLRGSASPEPYYADGQPAVGGGLTLTGSPAQATHPPTYGRDDLTDAHAAWALDLVAPEGVVYAASTELAATADVDVLGRVYPHRIVNGDTVTVAKSIQDGVVVPGSATVVLRNDTAAIPAEIRGLALWCEADQIAAAADGDTVTTWPDLSGHGRDLVQASSSGPTWERAAVNGRPALRFDSATEVLAIPSGVSALFGDAQIATLVVCFAKLSAGTSRADIVSGVGSNWRMSTQSGNLAIENGSSIALGSTPAAGLACVVSHVQPSVTSRAYRDAGAEVTGGASDFIGARLCVGAFGDASNTADAHVCAVLGFNRALGMDERRRIENYLAAKYGAPIDHGHLTRATEWRDRRVILRRYERRSHELVTELVGVVGDVDWSRPGHVALTITGASQAALAERIPKRLINVDEHPDATDLGAPIPVVFGTAWVSAPYIGRDKTSSPGGEDFAVSHIEDADGVPMDVRVERVLMDLNGAPGLEELSGWRPGGGSPTRHSDTVLQLAGARDLFYQPGLPLRARYGSEHRYSRIVSYDTGTNRVTLAEAILAGGDPDAVELVTGGYLIDVDTYETASAPVLAVALQGVESRGGVVAWVRNHTYDSPADVVRQILTDELWGLGQTVDAGMFAEAAADFADVSLQNAANFAIGGDRQQRTARTLLGQLLGLRGAWLEMLEDGAWGIHVDKEPPAARRSFGYREIERIGEHVRTPLAQAVRTLKLRYGQRGRIRTEDNVASWFAPADFEFQVNRDVLAIGMDRVETNPWLRRATEAGRVCAYRGKRLAAEDESIAILVGFLGRNVRLGEVIRLSHPHADVLGDYRVTAYQRGLRATNLICVGYDPGIFSYTSSDVYYDGGGANSEADTSNPDTGATPSSPGPNQVLNANFALTSGTFTAASTQLNAAFLPGWIISHGTSSPDAITDVTPTPSRLWVGGGYVEIEVANTDGDPKLRTNSQLSNAVVPGGIVVEPGEPYFFSAYVANDAEAPEDAIGWRAVLQFFDAADAQVGSDVTLSLVSTGETTGQMGAYRWFSGFRPPASTAYVVLEFRFTSVGIWQIGGVAINRLDRFTWRPPPWRNRTLES